MKIRSNKPQEKKVSRLQKSQDENVGWWNKFTEDQKIAMGLRYPYYKHISFAKTETEKVELRQAKIKFKVAEANK
jgi:hypothetical protein